jgi:S-DNA-T family DNA segregation ATPase FtsK/SpoIIIE
VRECSGIALIGLAVLAAFALWTYDPADALFTSEPVQNMAGVLGAAVAAALYASVGYGSVLVVLAVAVLGARLMLGQGLPELTSRFWISAPLLLVSTATLPLLVSGAISAGFDAPESGALGRFLASHETWLVGSWGALLLNATLLIIGVLATTGVSTGRMLGALGVALGALLAGVTALCMRAWRALLAVACSVQQAAIELARGVERGWRALGVWREQRARRARVAAARRPSDESEVGISDAPEHAVAEAARPAPHPARSDEPQIIDHAIDRSQQRKARQEAFAFAERESHGPYRRPDPAIFQVPPESARTYDHDSLIMNSRILEKKLQDFGVGGSVVKVHPGPVITMYEFAPASGIKVNKIVGLADDLALALRAMSVRIIAPLPGKSVVGVEVANSERDTVYLRDLLECDRLRDSRSLVPVALGKDIFGNPIEADLAKMPHLLVAGATGTGKSVFLNALLCSVLCRFTPDELKLLLVDPKLLELSVYAGIPHLIADVVTNPKRAAAALAGIVRKMEERYQIMAALGVRSIQQFNERCEKEREAGNKTFRLKPKPGEEEGEEVEFRPLPYIVVVIDELADLMVVSAKDVEE